MGAYEMTKLFLILTRGREPSFEDPDKMLIGALCIIVVILAGAYAVYGKR